MFSMMVNDLLMLLYHYLENDTDELLSLLPTEVPIRYKYL
jgi:hypothetical protein